MAEVYDKKTARKQVAGAKYKSAAFWRHNTGMLLLWVVMIGIMYVMIYPLLQVLTTSVKTYGDMLNPTSVWLTRTFAWENYVRAYNAMGFASALGNTMLITCTAPILQLMSSSLTGYGFARFKFRERGLLFGILLFSLVVPQQVTSLPLFLMYRQWGVLNTYLPIIIPSAFGQGLKSALFVYIFRQFFRGLPKELEDAAYIDGCGFFKTFLRIMLPNAIPAALTVFLFSFVWHYNDIYLTQMFTTRPDLATLSMRLVNIMGYLLEPGVARDPVQYIPIKYAGVFMVILPMILVYLFGQKYFVEGVERSGIVG